ncbi:MAG TPA: NAD(P)/FAD-dependent oxidoreductase [Verrucomicrobiae bacterium]|nr:NAD(P)/FAD-dependent oxidoreductase [Verrucomicrobiae bacterium]
MDTISAQRRGDVAIMTGQDTGPETGDGPVDAIVVGAGPNGLAAAITLARAGRSVRVLEAADVAGGGLRTAELTLPGFRHDPCATIVPLTAASPFFRTVDLAARGVELIHPDAPFAHPLDGGAAAVLERSVSATAAGLGADDGRAWRTTFGPLVRRADDLADELLRPVLHMPRHPLALATFGRPALRSAEGFANGRFRDPPARALFAGVAAHSMLRLDRPLTASFGLVLATFAHSAGWPMVRGGSAAVVDALVAELEAAGGSVVTGRRVASFAELPPARAVLFDVTPRQLVAIAGDRLTPRTRRHAERFRYGSGVFKVDWALDGPVPWMADGPRRAATVHVGGTLGEIAAAEADVAAGRHPDRPYVLFVQYQPWDVSRAPAGKGTAWAYCHVPAGSIVDMTSRIEAQVERFAPGFRDLILARATHGPAAMEAYDANYVGGDINGGIQDIRQLVFRPWPMPDPYRLGDGLYLCSSSTPPGGGVHGMCGMLAARSALRHELR